MKSAFINLIIVSGRRRIRNYFLSFRESIFYSVLYIFLFLLTISSVAYFNYSFKLKKDRYEHLKNYFSEEISDNEREMKIMAKYMEKINLMIEYNLVSTVNEKSQKYGIGGGEELSIVEINYANSEDKEDNISNKNESIFERMENIEDGMEDLVLHLQNMIIRLNSTPSIFPTNGIITSGFGYRKSPFTGRRELHRGIDILNEEGTPIIAPADGIIKEISSNSLWGNSILIQHINDIETQYGHLKDIEVKVGQKVKRGDVIGTLGSTGRITGPHLHYQIWVNKTPIDPMDYIIEENIEMLD